MFRPGDNMRKPFKKKGRPNYYVEIDRKQINLGTDKEAAYEEYHRLMAGRTPVNSRTTVAALLDQFLTWTKDNRSESTFTWYEHYVVSFARFVGPKMKVGDLKPGKVDDWLKRSLKDAGNTGKNGAVRAISRAFNWAKRQRLIQDNPVWGVERPAAEPREVYISADQWKEVFAKIKPADPFFDLLVFLKETGCRPFEARMAEAAHWDRGDLIILERKKSKGKKTRRVIRLNAEAQGIVAKLSLKHPEGPLFLNRKGRPWTASAIDQCFGKLEKKLGFEFFPYAVRHTFCTDSLLRGVGPLETAILMGHRDAKMVMEVYAHLCQQHEHLRKKLRQATGKEDVA
jgi:integrase